MIEANLVILVVKTLSAVLLVIYLLFAVLISRQVFLMNKAIKTKLSGCLNLLSIAHILLVLLVFIAIILVR